MSFILKLFLADLVLYTTAVYSCWVMNWKYAFAGIGALAVIDLSKNAIRIVRFYRFLKKLDQDIG